MRLRRLLTTRGLAFTPYSDSAKYSLLLVSRPPGPGDVQPVITVAVPTASESAELRLSDSRRAVTIIPGRFPIPLIVSPLHEHRRRKAGADGRDPQTSPSRFMRLILYHCLNEMWPHAGRFVAVSSWRRAAPLCRSATEPHVP